MNGAGKPFVFLTRSIPGSPPILWVGNQKFELDRGTVIHWTEELTKYLCEEAREHERSTKT